MPQTSVLIRRKKSNILKTPGEIKKNNSVLQLQHRKKTAFINELDKQMAASVPRIDDLLILYDQINAVFAYKYIWIIRFKTILCHLLAEAYQKNGNFLAELRYRLEYLMLSPKFYGANIDFVLKMQKLPLLQHPLILPPAQTVAARVKHIQEEYQQNNKLSITPATDEAWKIFMNDPDNQDSFTHFLSRTILASLGSLNNLPFIVLAAESFINTHDFRNKEASDVYRGLVGLIVHLILPSSILPDMVAEKYIQQTRSGHLTLKSSLDLIEKETMVYFNTLSTIISRESCHIYNIKSPQAIRDNMAEKFKKAWGEKKLVELERLNGVGRLRLIPVLLGIMGLILSCAISFYNPWLSGLVLFLTLALLYKAEQVQGIKYAFLKKGDLLLNTLYKIHLNESQEWCLPGFTIALQKMDEKAILPDVPVHVENVSDRVNFSMERSEPQQTYRIYLVLNEQAFPASFKGPKIKTRGVAIPPSIRSSPQNEADLIAKPQKNPAKVCQKYIRLNNLFQFCLVYKKNMFPSWVHEEIKKTAKDGLLANKWGNSGIKLMKQGGGLLEIKPPRSDQEHKNERAFFKKTGVKSMVLDPGGQEKYLPIYEFCSIGYK